MNTDEFIISTLKHDESGSGDNIADKFECKVFKYRASNGKGESLYFMPVLKNTEINELFACQVTVTLKANAKTVTKSSRGVFSATETNYFVEINVDDIGLDHNSWETFLMQENDTIKRACDVKICESFDTILPNENISSVQTFRHDRYILRYGFSRVLGVVGFQIFALDPSINVVTMIIKISNSSRQRPAYHRWISGPISDDNPLLMTISSEDFDQFEIDRSHSDIGIYISFDYAFAYAPTAICSSNRYYISAYFRLLCEQYFCGGYRGKHKDVVEAYIHNPESFSEFVLESSLVTIDRSQGTKSIFSGYRGYGAPTLTFIDNSQWEESDMKAFVSKRLYEMKNIIAVRYICNREEYVVTRSEWEKMNSVFLGTGEETKCWYLKYTQAPSSGNTSNKENGNESEKEKQKKRQWKYNEILQHMLTDKNKVFICEKACLFPTAPLDLIPKFVDPIDPIISPGCKLGYKIPYNPKDGCLEVNPNKPESHVLNLFLRRTLFREKEYDRESLNVEFLKGKLGPGKIAIPVAENSTDVYLIVPVKEGYSVKIVHCLTRDELAGGYVRITNAYNAWNREDAKIDKDTSLIHERSGISKSGIEWTWVTTARPGRKPKPK